MSKKFNFGQTLYSIEDQVIKYQEQDLTLRAAAIEALQAMFPEEKLSGEHKLLRNELARKVLKADESTEFTIEESALIKDQIGKVWNVSATGAAWNALEKGVE